MKALLNELASQIFRCVSLTLLCLWGTNGLYAAEGTLDPRIPADITLLVLDLKYSEAEGVKICEIQNGIRSVIRMVNFLPPAECEIEHIYPERLASIFPEVLYTRLHRGGIKKNGEQLGWRKVGRTTIKGILDNPQPVNDPRDLRSYKGCVISHHTHYHGSRKKIWGGCPYIFISFPTFHNVLDKKKLALLFMGDEELERFRPATRIYKKGDPAALASAINSDFSAERLVIKPIGASRGRGVILFEKKDLSQILETIFGDRESLMSMRDTSFSYWAKCKQSEFLVEEFAASDPVMSTFDNALYDGTMRVFALLTYDRGEISVEILSYNWKFPRHPVNGEKGLQACHKAYSSKAPESFAPVSESMKKGVRRDLEECLVPLYRNLLNSAWADVLRP